MRILLYYELDRKGEMQVRPQQLNTWAEIARYMGMSVRAAQNYEKTAGLPVKHMPGSRGRVWAYANELDDWKRERSLMRRIEEDSDRVGTSTQRDEISSESSQWAAPEKGAVINESDAPGGEPVHIGVAALLYGLLWGESLVLEVAYRFPDFARPILKSSFGVSAWISAGTVCTLWANSRLNCRNRPALAFLAAIGLILIAAGGVQAAVYHLLPGIPVTRASFQTMPASAAYFKNIVLYFLPLALVFMILPFHAVQVRRALRRHCPAAAKNNYPLFSGFVASIQPWVLWLLLGLAFLLSLVLGSHLFDNLQPGPHSSLFVQLVFGRGALCFALAVECTAWYHANYRRLDCLKGLALSSRSNAETRE